MVIGCPQSARLLNRCDASAKSRTALIFLARETVSGLPLSSSVEPPSRLDTLLNASPIFTPFLNFRRISLRFEQSTNACDCFLRAAHALIIVAEAEGLGTGG